ncbi:MAG TPA: RNA polymerase sigma factor, partial [Thermoanaerobaculia bacterium]|nr:RNA polymerase sigma factor [Thermoanaerobaculia bacterium]
MDRFRRLLPHPSRDRRARTGAGVASAADAAREEPGARGGANPANPADPANIANATNVANAGSGASATNVANAGSRASAANLAGTGGGAGDLADEPGGLPLADWAAAAGGALDDCPRPPVYRGQMLELVYSRRQSSQTSPWAEVSDRDLLLAVRGGDEAALDQLIGRKTKPLLQLVSRILGDLEEARDVVQVTFFKVWENRRKFDERWSPNTWIYRIASNLAIDHLRARRSRERSHEPVRQHLRQVADSRAHRDLSRLQQGEVAAIFRELAAALSEKQRLVFLMREVEGMSSPEVAGILGCRESTVRNHLFNARKYLRGELLRRYPEYAANFAALPPAPASASPALPALPASPTSPTSAMRAMRAVR